MRVILPRVGLISLAGLPVASIPDSVRSAIRALLMSRSIEVVPLRRIGVVGEVREPGVYYVDLTTRLSDVISLAGGVGDRCLTTAGSECGASGYSLVSI